MTTLPEIVNRSLVFDQPYLVAIAFTKSRAREYPQAVRLAQMARFYREQGDDSRPTHLAVFGRERDQAEAAVALMDLMGGRRSFHCFVDGRPVFNYYDVRAVLLCYLKSLAVKRPDLHCHVIVKDPLDRPPPNLRLVDALNGTPAMRSYLERAPSPRRFTLPCSYVRQSFRYLPDQPGSPQEQLHAHAVEKHCHMCPHFNESDFKPAPVTYW